MGSGSKNSRRNRRAKKAAKARRTELINERAARNRELLEKAVNNSEASDAAAEAVAEAVAEAMVSSEQASRNEGGLRRFLHGRPLVILILAIVLIAAGSAAIRNARQNEVRVEIEPISDKEIVMHAKAENDAAKQAALEAAEKAAAEQAAREAEERARIAEEQARQAAEQARLAEEERIRNLPKRIVFIGDSRTVQLERAVDYDKTFCYFVAEVSMGYDWMRSTGVPQADGLITDRTAVVINMGVNDLANAERYAEYVNELYSRWTGRGAKVWYMSVNPVGPQASVTNEQIDEFNSTMREKLNSGIKWIDTNSMLMQQGFTAGDSLHYDEKTYQKIYDFVFRALGLTT